MEENRQGKQQSMQKEKRLSIHRRLVPVLSPEQARTLLATGKGHQDEVLLTLALVLGLRAGELLALQWQALDWKAGSLRIDLTRSAPQGSMLQPSLLPAKHPRTILLPRLVMNSLQEHLLRRQQELACAEAPDLIFCTQQGHPLSPDRLTPIVQEALRQACLPVLRFHEVRQTTAHLLLLFGVAPQSVGVVLGIGAARFASDGLDLSCLRAHAEVARQAMEQLFFAK